MTSTETGICEALKWPEEGGRRWCRMDVHEKFQGPDVERVQSWRVAGATQPELGDDPKAPRQGQGTGDREGVTKKASIVVPAKTRCSVW